MKRFVPRLLALLVCAALTVTVAQTITPETVNLSWTAPTLNTDGTTITAPLTYNLYQGTASGAETLAQSGLTGTSIAVSTGLTPGKTYYWQLTAVANGVESARSTEVSAGIPFPSPNTATGVQVSCKPTPCK